MKLETASPFLRVNAVAQRARQLLMGATPRTRMESRQPTAIALAELRAGSIEVFDPDEAREILVREAESAPEEERAASEAARVAFEEMWAEQPGEDAGDEASEADGESSEPSA